MTKHELTTTDHAAGGRAVPAKCDVAVVFALSIEAGGLVDLLSRVTVTRGDGFTLRQGELHGRHVVLAESGAGRLQATKVAHALIDAHRPRWLVSAGFAGALVPELPRGQIIVAEELVDAAGRHWTADPLGLPAWLSQLRGVQVGRLLVLDHVVCQPDVKKALGREHGALAVDMESLAMAEVCRARDIPFLAIRAVSDAVNDELPHDVERLLRQKTTAARAGAALRSIWRRPSAIKDLFHLQQNALAVSERLAGVLAELTKNLE